MRINDRLRLWVIPVIYIFISIALGVLLPQISLLLPNNYKYFDSSTAVEILSTVTSGMIAFTGFVFTMAILLVQFGSNAYSPRLAVYLIQDQVVQHAIGIFSATFLFSLIAMMMVTLYSDGTVPDLAILIVFLSVLASVFFFLALIQRVTSLQVTRVLHSIGRRGRKVIDLLYKPYLPPERILPDSDHPEPQISDLPAITQVIHHQGDPGTVLTVNYRAMIRLARISGAIIQLNYPPGDMVPTGAPLLSVHGGQRRLRDWQLRRLVHMGIERTIEQDPKYAIRLIVDIAIRALSPAVNDPTTAVQALDELDDLLRRLSQRRLNVDMLFDHQGQLRVLYSTPSWEDFLALAIDEIRLYGATSLQVMRRLLALLDDLKIAIPYERVPAVDYHIERVRSSIERNFADQKDQDIAFQQDRQGIGLSRNFDETPDE